MPGIAGQFEMKQFTPYVGGLLVIAGFVLVLLGQLLLGGAFLSVGFALFIFGWRHFA
jgi:hypothetical protein